MPALHQFVAVMLALALIVLVLALLIARLDRRRYRPGWDRPRPTLTASGMKSADPRWPVCAMLVGAIVVSMLAVGGIK